MKNKWNKKIIVAGVLAFAMLLTGCGNKSGEVQTDEAQPDEVQESVTEVVENVTSDLSDAKVGVCIYQFADNYMTLYRTELEEYLISLGFVKENITIADGANDQATQTQQIQNFITNGTDVLVVNLVNASSAETVTDMIVGAEIPLIYINREPDEAEQARWEANNWNVTYVGAEPSQAGTMQGELIADIGLEKLDFNQNGKVDYIMIEGDPENIDAQYRTEYSIKALTDAGLEVNCLDDQVGNWDQATAQQLVANALGRYGDDIEVVFCNNDAMALGALQSISAAGRMVGKDIYLVGVDALTEALEKLENDTLTGTVLTNHITQSHQTGDCVAQYVRGENVEHYYVLDYVKVTKENIQEIKSLLGE